MDFTPAEQQILALLDFLEKRQRPRDLHAIQDSSEAYFGMYRLDWTGAMEKLIGRGYLHLEEGQLHLTDAGRPLAARLRLQHPKHRYFYDEFFSRAASSRAHAELCEQVYGKNLCQHGLMDMTQLERMLQILDLGKRSCLLELGCGNGMIAEYIAATTGAQVTGLDISGVGIQQALERTKDRSSQLAFIQTDMLCLDFPPNRFDSVIAIDSLYFVSDLLALLDRLDAIVLPGGQLGVFWSSWQGDDDPASLLQASETPFAQALKKRGLPYQAWDLTVQEIEHWTRKLQVVNRLKAAFEAEGNQFLFNNRFLEANTHQRFVSAGRVSRYFYRVQLGR
jgi:ubiquinone/menaquinone biosynthesis C-methylase UbiE